MDFLQELKKIAIQEFGVDATPVFNFKSLDPAYVQSILEKPFARFYKSLSELKQNYGASFKQELYNLVLDKASSGYTKRSAKSILQAAYHYNFINLEEYTYILKNIFNDDPDKDFIDSAKKDQLVMSKENIENSDPFAPLYL